MFLFLALRESQKSLNLNSTGQLSRKLKFIPDKNKRSTSSDFHEYCIKKAESSQCTEITCTDVNDLDTFETVFSSLIENTQQDQELSVDLHICQSGTYNFDLTKYAKRIKEIHLRSNSISMKILNSNALTAFQVENADWKGISFYKNFDVNSISTSGYLDNCFTFYSYFPSTQPFEIIHSGSSDYSGIFSIPSTKQVSLGFQITIFNIAQN